MDTAGVPQRVRPPPLSSRQTEVIGLVARGYRTRDIGKALGISERAVTAHITRLMRSFGVPNRSGLIAAVMSAAGFGIPRDRRPPLTRLAAQAHIAVLHEQEHEQYVNAPFVVAVTRGPRHVFTFVNRAWERVFDLRSGDVIGREVRQVFPDAPPTTYTARQRAYRQGRPSTGQMWHFRWTQGDGTRREADFNYIFQPIRTAAGRTEGLLMIATEADETAPRERARGKR